MKLYFDFDRLSQGNFYFIEGKIQTTEGHSYELEDWIGRGGNAAVYQCRHSVTGDEYAIKFHLNQKTWSTKRFEREISLLKQIAGDHTTKYYGAGHVNVTHNNSSDEILIPFVVMELAENNLQEIMREIAEPLNYEQYAGQFRGLAGALATIHKCAIHRDIKPENILITGERWLLSDYGLCTFVNQEQDDLTHEWKNIGPKFWLSPEAHNRRLGCGDHINAASDVFQLASIFWYVVTGRYPSGIVTKNDWTGPDKLFNVLHKSLFHDHTKRPQNGGEFFTELADALSQ